MKFGEPPLVGLRSKTSLGSRETQKTLPPAHDNGGGGSLKEAWYI